MLEAPVQHVMERSYSQKQERFIRLFLSTSPEFADIRDKRELIESIKSACVKFFQAGYDPNEEYSKAEERDLGGQKVKIYSNPVQKRLTEKLINEEGIERLIAEKKYESVRKTILSLDDIDYKKMIDSMKEEEFRQYADKNFSSWDLEMTCDNISYAVCEAHRYFNQKHAA